MRSLVKSVIGLGLAVAAIVLVHRYLGDPAPEPPARAPAEGQTSGAPQAAAGSADRAGTAPETGSDGGGATGEQVASVPATDTEPDPEPAATPPVTPTFDVVRIAPDGQAVIAGHAGPGRTVEILLDGTVIGTVETDGSGAFATVVAIPPAAEPRELVLRATLASAPETQEALAAAPDAEAPARPGPAREREPAAAPAPEPEGSTAAPAAPAAPPPVAGTDPGTDPGTGTAGSPGAGSAPAAPAPGAPAAPVPGAPEITADLAEPPPGAAPAAPGATAAAPVSTAPASTAPASTAPGTAAPAPVEAIPGPDRLAAAPDAAESPGAPPRAEAAPAATAPALAGAASPDDPAAPPAAPPSQAATPAADAPKPDAPAGPAGHTEGTPRPGAPARSVQVALSEPVVILPQQSATEAPAVVRPEADGVNLLQPAFGATDTGIVLDRITYEDGGAIVVAGRGRPGAVIRVYANAELLTEARAGEAGYWQARVPYAIAADTLLLRFDEIGPEGAVASRLETPFAYSPNSVAQELRQREIVVQRGDYLWKFAEQHYGRGIRYSVIFEANAHLIRDPDLIYPGQVFTVPELVDSQ